MKSKKSANRIMINRILSNKILLIPLLFIFSFLFIALFSYQIMPDDTPMANSIELSIAKKNQVFKLNFYFLKKKIIWQIKII